MLRLWFLVILACAGALAPSRACARIAETRAEVFLFETENARPESAAQVADSHLANPLHGYDLTSGCCLAAENAPQMTRLWRAVENPELADVMKYGDYNIHPNSTFKRFAFDEGSLDTFIEANPARTYTKTFIDVPSEKLPLMIEHGDPGGVGRAIGIDVYEHPEFYDWFNSVGVKH